MLSELGKSENCQARNRPALGLRGQVEIVIILYKYCVSYSTQRQCIRAMPRLNRCLDVTKLRVEGLPCRKYRILIGAAPDHSEVGLADEAE